MRARNASTVEKPERESAALRDLVRLLARQAAAEHVRAALQDSGSGR
jgi:hypothetical protein